MVVCCIIKLIECFESWLHGQLFLAILIFDCSVCLFWYCYAIDMYENTSKILTIMLFHSIHVHQGNLNRDAEKGTIDGENRGESHTTRKVCSYPWSVIVFKRSIVKVQLMLIIIRKMSNLLLPINIQSGKVDHMYFTRGRRIAAVLWPSDANRCNGCKWNWCILNSLTIARFNILRPRIKSFFNVQIEKIAKSREHAWLGYFLHMAPERNQQTISDMTATSWHPKHLHEHLQRILLACEEISFTIT